MPSLIGNNERRLCISFCAAVLLLVSPAVAEIAFPPSYGERTAENHYVPDDVPVFATDFETDPQGIIYLNAETGFTTEPGEAIQGARSLVMGGDFGGLVLIPQTLNLRPFETYSVCFEYNITDPGDFYSPFIVFVEWPGMSGFEAIIGGLNSWVDPLSGKMRCAIRLPDVTNVQIAIVSLGSRVIIDDLKILRHDARVETPRLPLVKAAFPRLASYNLDSTPATALRNGVPLTEVESTLGLFDLVNGVDVERTFSRIGWVDDLRAINPDLLLMPYFQSFVAQLLPGEVSLAGAARLRPLFNEGLRDEWFMKGPDGSLLNEPLYPQNFQMNHTAFCPVVEGHTFTDYALRFLSQTVMATGVWDGIHFDQTEWYPNPLLGEGDPFLGGTGPLPPIDLNNDGVAETTPTLFTEWRNAFKQYFGEVHKTFGYTQFIVGNSGYIPDNPGILPYLNGWQREFIIPFAVDANFDFITNDAAPWYGLLNNYLAANRLARAPQTIKMQFTGYGLGTPNGNTTANGLADRVPVLEPRDFPRMRFGLATTLLGDGFYGYTYVDNTTAPVWFDEFAVVNGTASKTLAGKGYLGQPLADAAELPYDGQTILNLDFESDPPPGVDFGASYQLTSQPGEVIDGNRSLVVSTMPSAGANGNWIFLTTDPAQIPLLAGESYRLEADWRLLEYESLTNLGVFLATITDPVTGLTNPNRNAWVIYPDVDGPGQQGKLTTVVRPGDNGFYATLWMLDTVRVAIDNVRLIQGGGGVWRRDFENGVVLVNPTPTAKFVSQAEIAGPLGRTGIRRILGTQDPTVNNGAVVNAGLSLAPGDGIVLLANGIAAPAPTAPSIISASSTENSVTLHWTPSQGVFSGYKILYGESGGEMTQLAAAGKTKTNFTVDNLLPGRDYRFQIAPYDYRGNLGPAGAPFIAATQGAAPALPTLDTSFWRPTVAPGDYVYLAGQHLSGGTHEAPGAPYPFTLGGTQLTVNGLPAPIVTVNPDSIIFILPARIAGPVANVRAIRDGVPGPVVTIPIRAASPFVWTWDQTNVIAFRPDYDFVTAFAPARPGDSVTVIVSGVGQLEPSPTDGQYAAPDAAPRHIPTIRIAGQTLPVDQCIPFLDLYGFFAATVTIPPGLPAGDQPIELLTAGQTSNAATIAIAP